MGLRGEPCLSKEGGMVTEHRVYENWKETNVHGEQPEREENAQESMKELYQNQVLLKKKAKIKPVDLYGYLIFKK